MPDTTARVEAERDALSVQSANLLKRCDQSKLLKFHSCAVRVAISLTAFPKWEEKERNIVAMAKKEMGEIEGELDKIVDDVIKDVEKAVKEDQSGNRRACDEAKKAVDEAEKKIKKVMPEIGPRLRNALVKTLKGAKGTVKIQYSGSFAGIDLLTDFKGDAERYEAAHVKLAKNIDEFLAEVTRAESDDGKKRVAYVAALKAYQKELKASQASIRDPKEQEDKWAKDFRKQNTSLANKVTAACKTFVDTLKQLMVVLQKAEKDISGDAFRRDSKVKEPLRDFSKELDAFQNEVRAREDKVERSERVLDDPDWWNNVESDIYDMRPLISRFRKTLLQAKKELVDLQRGK